MDSAKHFLEDGDLVQFDRGTIRHWGIYDGGFVIHVTGETELSNDSGPLGNLAAGVMGRVNAKVKREKLKEVSDECDFYQNNQLDKTYTPFTAEETVERARKHIGETWNYYLLSSNCEHFASKMRYGFPISLQVWVAGATAVGIGVGLVVAGGSTILAKNNKKCS